MAAEYRRTAYSPGRAGLKVWESSELLAESVEAYFDSRKAENLPPTCTGLCLYLGISMHTLRVCIGAEQDPAVLSELTASERAEAEEILCYASLRIQSCCEEQLYLKGSWHAGEKLCAAPDGVLSPLRTPADAGVRFELPDGLLSYTV